MLLKTFLINAFLMIWTVDLGQCSTLKLLVTVSRHGDRTTDSGPTYPTDPFFSETYAPYGKGELTNVGKNRMYGLGQTIRKLYDSFLGRLYEPKMLEALSTDYSRTKASLQLFLAGLFPPRNTVLEWNRYLNWNPIAYNYVGVSSNRVLSFPMLFCPKYIRIYEAYWTSPEATTINNYYKPMYPYISQHTGLNVTFVRHLFELFFTLSTQDEWGLRLPDWTRRVYPSYMEKSAEDNYKLFTATPELNQLFGGFLLKKVINDVTKKLNDSSNEKKMYVYSGHELTVASMLGALNMYYPHVPRYSACVILEFHQISQTAYVKVRYNRKSYDHFDDMEIPGCQMLCPLETFIELVGNHLPSDGDPCIEKESRK